MRLLNDVDGVDLVLMHSDHARADLSMILPSHKFLHSFKSVLYSLVNIGLHLSLLILFLFIFLAFFDQLINLLIDLAELVGDLANPGFTVPKVLARLLSLAYFHLEGPIDI